jgi:hypothetical protein
MTFATRYRRGVPGEDMLRCRQDATRKARSDLGAQPREFTGEETMHACRWSTRRRRPSRLWRNPLEGVPTRRPRSAFTARMTSHTMHGFSDGRPAPPRPARARRSASSASTRAADSAG